MIKIKKTKKQDFQNTINLDSKSQLAKLLATENVTVQHNNVATASFDVANRVLTLPIFKIKDKHVYDMLITHECGHALHTKVDDWSEISSDDRLRMAVNILEDTRIDKIMQNTYPGVINDYKKGFDKLNDSDFYGLQDRDINTLSILDKINMRSKSLERMNITFTDEELIRCGVSTEIRDHPNFVQKGQVIDRPDQFDAYFWGIGKEEAKMMDPQQRLFLQTCWHAMEDAGYPPRSGSNFETGVFASCGIDGYMIHHLEGAKVLREGTLDPASIFKTEVGNEKDYIATRVSYHLNLGGPSYTINSACSSGLVSVSEAVNSIQSGRCEYC